MRLYAVEFEVLDGARLVEQTTAYVHAADPDEAITYVRGKRPGKALRFHRIAPDPEPDDFASVPASPLEPLPRLGVRRRR